MEAAFLTGSFVFAVTSLRIVRIRGRWARSGQVLSRGKELIFFGLIANIDGSGLGSTLYIRSNEVSHKSAITRQMRY